MDDAKSTEGNAVLIPDKPLSEPPTKMSKRQLKRLLREKKWLERKGEKRLGTPDVTRQQRTRLNCDDSVVSFYFKAPRINFLVYNFRTFIHVYIHFLQSMLKLLSIYKKETIFFSEFHSIFFSYGRKFIYAVFSTDLCISS